ncbi:MAG: T9SS type A sorting domain-containing protein [Bacteroidota bacterium]
MLVTFPISENKEMKSSAQIPLFDSIKTWNWDTINSVWVPNMLTYPLSYDSNGNLLSQTQQTWNGASWDNTYYNEYTYNSNNNQLTLLLQTWNGTSWDTYDSIINTFDGANNHLTQLQRHWNGTTWVNDQLITQTFFNNSILSYVLTTGGLGYWGDVFSKTYTYDNVSNNLIGVDAITNNMGTWENDWKLTGHTYDSNYNLTYYLYKVWSGTSWDDNESYSFTYDSNHQLLTKLSITYSGGLSNSGLVTNTYNANNKLVNQVNQFWTMNSWHNASSQRLGYDANNINVWKVNEMDYNLANSPNTKDSTYYYYRVISGIAEQNTPETITIYPNPAHDWITIRGNDIEWLMLYDVLGRTVTTATNLQGPYQMNVATLPRGLYFLSAKTKTQTIYKKIVLN